MRRNIINLFLIIIVVLFISCSGREGRIRGKWSLNGAMIAGSPTSFWFKRGGMVVAPWEAYRGVLESKGEYEFIDDNHIKISMYEGYYNGNIYYFEIVKLDEKELVLKTNFQEIRMKRIEG